MYKLTVFLIYNILLIKYQVFDKTVKLEGSLTLLGLNVTPHCLISVYFTFVIQNVYEHRIYMFYLLPAIKDAKQL